MDRNLRKVKQGVVSSDKMDKTITVVVENRKRHPMYNKIMTTTKKLNSSSFRYQALAPGSDCGKEEIIVLE